MTIIYGGSTPREKKIESTYIYKLTLMSTKCLCDRKSQKHELYRYLHKIYIQIFFFFLNNIFTYHNNIILIHLLKPVFLPEYHIMSTICTQSKYNV